MEKSPTIDRLLAALSKAQGAFKPAKKDSNNPEFDHNYADLASIINVTQADLAANGLSVMQLPGCDKDGVFVETLLGHESGEWISGKLHVQSDAQGMGSAITYGRRYAMQSVLRVAAEDDDGNGAQKRPDALNGSSDGAKQQRKLYAKLEKPAEADWPKVTVTDERQDIAGDITTLIFTFSNTLEAFTQDAELATKVRQFKEAPAKARVQLYPPKNGKTRFKLLSLEAIPQ